MKNCITGRNQERSIIGCIVNNFPNHDAAVIVFHYVFCFILYGMNTVKVYSRNLIHIWSRMVLLYDLVITIVGPVLITAIKRQAKNFFFTRETEILPMDQSRNGILIGRMGNRHIISHYMKSVDGINCIGIKFATLSKDSYT